MPDYKWFGIPRKGIEGKRGEGGIGFLVSELLVDDVVIIKGVSIVKLYGAELRLEVV